MFTHINLKLSSRKVMIKLFQVLKTISAKRCLHTSQKCLWDIPKVAEFDLDYLLDRKNKADITSNIHQRKGVGNIDLIHELREKLNALDPTGSEFKTLESHLYKEFLKIPNRTHPNVAKYTEEPHVVKYIGDKKIFDYEPREFHEITKRLNLVRTDQLGNVSGNRSYFIMGEMAELEQALIKYALNNLLKCKFKLLSVPDILPRDIIESCGLNTRGERTQVYTLDPKIFGADLCLSGTSEMALAGYFMNKVFEETELPQKVAAVSRCYRAETSSIAEERGIYRVHEFTKVEMFAVTTLETSDDILEEFRVIEEEMFSDLDLHLRVLDMPPHELGAPAYRKYDVEAWLPGRKMFGEISSCSNCIDYQSRRLNIKYKSNSEVKHVHTLNGTACAIPRMLIALMETFQTDKGIINIPQALQKYMGNKSGIGRQKKVPQLRLIKHKK